MEMINLKNITKSYDNTKKVFENFNLDIEQGKCTVILGESGSGKTTLAKIILGTTGYSGEVIGVSNDISVVFQNNVLVPNLTVSQNLMLVNPTVNVKEALNLVELSDVENAYIKTLSAGMKRRVAIARAISTNTPLMILDEPFINLDLALKYSLMAKIKNLIKARNQTVIMITHDIGEASFMADRALALFDGKIVFDKECDFEDRENTQKELFNLMIGQGKDDRVNF